MSVVMDADFRLQCESLLDNVAIGSGVKAVIKELLKNIDEHQCKACELPHQNGAKRKARKQVLTVRRAK